MSRGYQTIMADPPWAFDNKLTAMKDGVKRGAETHYKTLDQRGIELFLRYSPVNVILGRTGWTAIEDEIADDAVLLLWAPSAHIVNGCASAVAKAWGFTPKQIVTWVKGRHTPERFVLQVGMGFYSRNCTEHMLVCSRGKATRLIQNKGLPNVIFAPRGRHSAKPLEAYRFAEQLLPSPRLSIFDRKQIEGWDVIGDEAPHQEKAA